MSSYNQSLLNYSKLNQADSLQHLGMVNKDCKDCAIHDDTTLIDRFSSMNDQLSLITDILHTEVDYYVDEIDQIMVCKGNLVEIQCNQLSEKHGLIARCLFVSELLSKANLSEKQLNGDPLFFADQSIAILKFNIKQDAEDFLKAHNSKFKVLNNNLSNENLLEIGSANNKKEPNSYLPPISFDNSNSNLNGYGLGVSIPLPIGYHKNTSLNSINSQTKIDLYNNHRHDSGNFSMQSSQNHIGDFALVSKQDVYETLTVKAKLRQKVDTQRSRQVTLQDIDAVMKQVVHAVQTEFMKRFPSSTNKDSRSITDGDE